MNTEIDLWSNLHSLLLGNSVNILTGKSWSFTIAKVYETCLCFMAICFVFLTSNFHCPFVRISLVNSAIVNYYVNDLGLQQQFDLFRKILFMEDGEFALSLSEQLFEKV